MKMVMWQPPLDQVAVIVVNEAGAELLERFQVPGYQLTPISHKVLPGCLKTKGHLGEVVAEAWQRYDHLVFVGATGIAVRAIAPLVENKFSDPSVIVVDIAGKFAISLLSGHAGGGNALALALSEAIGAQPVITTGTEVRGTAALEPVLAHFGLSPRFYREAILAVNGALLRGETVVVYGAFAKVFLESTEFVGNGASFVLEKESNLAHLGLWLDTKAPPEGWFDGLEAVGGKGFWLEVPTVVCGLGFRKGKSGDAIHRVLEEAMAAAGVRERQIKAFATIGIKASEMGFRSLMRRWKLPAAVVAIEAIEAVAERYQASPFVQQTLGIPAVAQPCADLVAQRLVSAFEGDEARQIDRVFKWPWDSQSLGRRYAQDGVTVAFSVLIKIDIY